MTVLPTYLGTYLCGSHVHQEVHDTVLDISVESPRRLWNHLFVCFLLLVVVGEEGVIV